MRTDGLQNKEFISLLDWSNEEVETILNLATRLKQEFANGDYHDHVLRAKTLFMLFYNQSLRTRNSSDRDDPVEGARPFLRTDQDLYACY